MTKQLSNGQVVRPANTGRRTIYGDYVALALSTGGAWHIQGPRPHEALCGKVLVGTPHQMKLHVGLLECAACMSRGGDLAESMRKETATGARS